MTQDEALDILKLGRSAFLTGPAGSGKTFLLNQYIDYLKKHQKAAAITASTGIAATHMNGVTIHSWSGIGVKEQLTQETLEEILRKPHLRKRFINTDVLIIDEISMLHAFQFDMVNYICQAFKEKHLPFGGMQVICSGDFFQLPPVQKQGRPAHFVTKSQIWQDMDIKVCYLEEQFRQQDSALFSLLNYIRNNSPQEAHNILSRSNYKKTNLPTAPVKLYTHNIDVDAINNFELSKIKEKGLEYHMISSGKKNLVTALKKSCLAPERLVLKRGAKVMFVKNNFDKGYVNGTLGEVIDFNVENLPIIETAEGLHITPAPASWVIEEDGEVKAQISQLPLRLAWAITVHKSQGMTLDAAEIDLSKSFVEGMGYVALSRVRSLQGLKLLGINEMAFLVNQEVLDLDQHLKQMSHQAVQALKALKQKERKTKQKQFLKSLSKIKKGKQSEQPKQPKTAKKPSIPTHQQTKILVSYKLSIKEMAEVRGMKEDTIISHLEKLIASGEALNIEYLKPPPERFQQIKQAFQQLNTTKLSPVRDLLGQDFSYPELRLTRLFLSPEP